MRMTDTSVDKPACPYCDAPLATSKARQCFSCGWDWHDLDNPQQLGDPNWNRFGLNAKRTYVVELCQESSGHRYTRYRDVDEGECDPNAVLATEPETGQQFIDWGYYEYAKHLRLTNGERFAFDAHGIWLTYAEIEGMRDPENRRLKGDQSFWFNGIAPLFPPK